MNTPLPRPLAVLLLPLILSGAPHRSQEPAPAAATAPPWPAARMAHDLVFHDELGQVLLLGGTPADPQGGLWAWNGAQWTPLAAGGPTDRYHFACAYDRHRELLFVHGGARGGPGEVELFADTWTFDGTQWQQVATDGPARDHHALAYLGARRQLVLFGGGHGEEAEFHGDTWLWTEDHWERATAEGPPARASHRLSEDSQRGRLVLYGGFGNGDTLLGDTWEWDGATWHPRAAGGPGTLAFPRTAR
jgi:hypothetical protein